MSIRNQTRPSAEQSSNVERRFNPTIERILSHRGYSSDQIKNLLSSNLNELPDLLAMHGMSKASERIIKAFESNEGIGIYGDYDVDGTTSCALFYHFFQMLGVEVKLYQPSRFVEGYGVHPSAIDEALKNDVKVLITVDCGITNSEACDYALTKGVDLIITDHHKDALEQMPSAYEIVNPNRRDEDEESELKFLAGVGVAFALCLQIKKDLHKKGMDMGSIYPLLPFVAIGTICDLARLTPMNLKLTRHGLSYIKKGTYPGLNAFISCAERAYPIIPSEKISFNVGPMINSKGRLDHPEKALKLLISDNGEECSLLYNQLEICNRERKFIQADVYKEAKEQVLAELKDDAPVFNVVYAPHWHEGVIGIVASKLVETFKVPSIVFSDSAEKGIIKGSARTAGQVSIFDLLQENKDLFIKFGGHKAAAGLSMKQENLPLLKKALNEELSQTPEILRVVQDTYDIQIGPEEINANLLKELEQLEPFGMGNKKPIFRMQNITIDSYQLMKDIHVRWSIKSKSMPSKTFRGISFNYIGKFNTPSPEELFSRQEHEELEVQFTLGINRFNGREYIQLMVEKFIF
ncbi:MAG: single-stranded-DNA-specific exonuclease RecJ [Bacteriovoracaceae bacterium]|nr:single-stranded-DNA-specific exonuclease RecJ [Bacteriovoracaceae bacterium]